MINIKVVNVLYKCGHHQFSELLIGKLAESIAQRSRTRCLNCFNTKSLVPSQDMEIGDRVWIDCRAFGFIHEPLVEAVIESIHSDRVLVKLVNTNILIDDPSPHQLVELKYISTQPND